MQGESWVIIVFQDKKTMERFTLIILHFLFTFQNKIIAHKTVIDLNTKRSQQKKCKSEPSQSSYKKH